MFSNLHLFLLCAAFTAYLFSAFALYKNKQLGLLIGLFVSALCMFSFAALLDDFINIWDERFHFLVAKNMMTHPFKPMLYADPVANIEYDNWGVGHIWLHKQPLFMWQMALSMKLFGKTIFAARLPSVLMSAAVVVALFRSGKLLANKTAGFFAATLMLTSFYWLEMVSGRQQLDQNDVAFIGYISLSMWAFLEYHFSKNRKWLIAIGFFAGFAILCKWLAGLFVYLIWGVFSLINYKIFKAEMLNLLKALGITILVFAPWQIYTAYAFPTESAIEHAYNAKHLWEPVEGHGGNWQYYRAYLRDYFDIIRLHLLAGAFILFFAFSKHKKLVAALLAAFVFQLAFFSWAATKMPSFAMVGWFVGVLALAIGLEKVIALLQFFTGKRKIVFAVIMLICFALIPLRILPLKFEKIHGENGAFADFIAAKKHNKAVFESIHLPADYVLFNVPGYHYVEAMFYLDVPVYSFVPWQGHIDDLLAKNRRVAVMRGKEPLPDHITKNPSILIIEGFTEVFE